MQVRRRVFSVTGLSGANAITGLTAEFFQALAQIALGITVTLMITGVYKL